MHDSSDGLPALDSLKTFWQDPDASSIRQRAALVGGLGYIGGAFIGGRVLSNFNGVADINARIQETRNQVDQLSAQEASLQQTPDANREALIATSTQKAIGQFTLVELSQQRWKEANSTAPELFLVAGALGVTCGLGYIALRFRSWRADVQQSIAYQNEQRLAANRPQNRQPQQPSHAPWKQPKAVSAPSNVIPLRKKRFGRSRKAVK